MRVQMRGSTYALLRAVRTLRSPLKYNHRAAWKYHLWPLNWVVGAHRVGCRDAWAVYEPLPPEMQAVLNGRCEKAVQARMTK